MKRVEHACEKDANQAAEKWLEEHQMYQFVRNQVKKPTQSPTMRWVFFLFRRITELAIPLDGTVEKSVANMTDELWDILSLIGKECEKYYV